uniref:Uncharacterized protein n=1 Tax=Cucumis melo TaxID=3656 RepID=A0A9I9DTV9_CUCME
MLLVPFFAAKVQLFAPWWERLSGNLLALILSLNSNYCPFPSLLLQLLHKDTPFLVHRLMLLLEA